METGMLLFDNDPRSDLMAKVIRAAEYYQRKYGKKPDVCFVHPSAVQESQRMEGNHFWIGLLEHG